MLRHADEARTKLRRATRELQRFGEQAMTARDASRPEDSHDASVPADQPFHSD